MSTRIVMASDFYPPFIGGMERQVQLLSRDLVRRGYEVHVATTWHPGDPAVADDQGVTVHRLRGLATSGPWFSRAPGRRFLPPLPEPGFTRAFGRLTARLQPDLVHANGWVAYSVAAAIVRRRTPLVVSVRDYGYTCALRTMLRDGQVCPGPQPRDCTTCAAQAYGLPKAMAAVGGVLANRGLLLRATHTFHCVSSYVRTVLERDLLRGDTSPATCVIPSFFVDSPPSASAEAVLERAPSESFVLYVGALQPHKGLDILLAAYRRLQSPPPLVLVGAVWGDTPRSFPAGVTVLSDVPHDAVMALWRRCSFGVVPSVWAEPLAATIREGMVSGRAVISTAIGGATDMLSDRETGLLVPPGDPAALAAAMQQLIDRPELSAALGAAARVSARRFTAAAVVPQFEQLYARALSGRTALPVETAL